MPDIATVIGYIAAFCTTTAFLPQLVQTLRTKDTRSISLGTYLLFMTGLASWLIYGILRWDMPVIAANTLSLAFATVIMAMKLRHG
jgi:MtN3 and saliva related transmembrane protein